MLWVGVDVGCEPRIEGIGGGGGQGGYERNVVGRG